MTVASIVMGIMLAVLFVALGVAKLLLVPFMARAAEHFGISPTNYRLIGVLELAAAGGLVIGLFWPPLGIAAAVGLVVLLIGAVVAHRRAGDGAKETFPAVWIALVSAATAVVTVLAV